MAQKPSINEKVDKCLEEGFSAKATIEIISLSPICKYSILFTETEKPYSKEDIPCEHAGNLQSIPKEGDTKSVIYFRHCTAQN